eukprot:m.771652 g.771652  ORF g.771652 m.771652 type:complete len:51 (-) comp59094_c0_seq1:396-548(-)
MLPDLVSWGLDPNYRTSEGCTALHFAAYIGLFEAVEFLLAVGADLSSQTS